MGMIDVSRVNWLGERIERLRALDAVADPAAKQVSELIGRSWAKSLLSGAWLGHPLHPVLTDIPIGSWTSASLLDLVGGRRAEPAADFLVVVGTLSAVPTALAGLSDWSDLGARARRVGVVHAAANLIGVALYTASLLPRRRGRRRAGTLLGLAGATTLTVGGLLGGHLIFRQGSGVDREAFDTQ